MNSRKRTVVFAVRGLKFADAHPSTPSGRTAANPIARRGRSVAANDRAALRGKSRADFAHEITAVLEEADATDRWIEIARRRGLVSPKRVAGLQGDVSELTNIFNATRPTAGNPKA